MIDKARIEKSSRSDPSPINFIEVFIDEIEKNKGNPNTCFTGITFISCSQYFVKFCCKT